MGLGVFLEVSKIILLIVDKNLYNENISYNFSLHQE